MYCILEAKGCGGPPTIALEYGVPETPPTPPLVTPDGRALQLVKSQIDTFYEEGKWDDYKKITNPYEYIFLSWNRRSSRSVATRTPLSRSYFKMIEIWHHLQLDILLAPMVAANGTLLTAHSAEGPGGFIEACGVAAAKVGWTVGASYAITLRSDAKNVPGWRKAARFLDANPQVKIHDGADGTGNILVPENRAAFVAAVREASPDGVHLYTADGGFDFSNDYNAQEDSVFSLLLAEAILGLQTLAKGGVMILKCFDTKEPQTLQLIWLLTRAFRRWCVMKPRTSRAGNAERYITCSGFLGRDATTDILNVLEATTVAPVFLKPVVQACSSWRETMVALGTLQEQIEHMELYVIQDTLRLLRDADPDVIRLFVRANVIRSIEWCREHDESQSEIWTSDLEGSVVRETADLLHILTPPVTHYVGGGGSAAALFVGFRSDVSGVPFPSNNPFMRMKRGGGTT